MPSQVSAASTVVPARVDQAFGNFTGPSLQALPQSQIEEEVLEVGANGMHYTGWFNYLNLKLFESDFYKSLSLVLADDHDDHDDPIPDLNRETANPLKILVSTTRQPNSEKRTLSSSLHPMIERKKIIVSSQWNWPEFTVHDAFESIFYTQDKKFACEYIKEIHNYKLLTWE